MNRDERHDRAAELPPQIIRADHTVFGPLDPRSGGTWIAYNDKGFWGCLLNGYVEQEPLKRNAYESRGQILPNILSQDNPLMAAQTIDSSHYQSFRLLVGSANSHKLFMWDGKNYAETTFHALHEDRVFFLSSSSWRQDEVIAIRKRLFEEWIKNNPNGGSEIPDFHCSQEPHAEAAPFMMRSYSGTKSITAMEISNDNIAMSYWTRLDIESNMKRQCA